MMLPPRSFCFNPCLCTPPSSPKFGPRIRALKSYLPDSSILCLPMAPQAQAEVGLQSTVVGNPGLGSPLVIPLSTDPWSWPAPVWSHTFLPTPSTPAKTPMPLPGPALTGAPPAPQVLPGGGLPLCCPAVCSASLPRHPQI